MGRASVCQKTGLKKGAWSPEEDKRLVICINMHGPWNWRELPKYAGLARCGKSCRLRWFNYLRPTTKRGNFTSEEDQVILDMHEKLGNKWSKIAKKLPGRTDNEIKNHWHTHLAKQITRSSKVKSKNTGYRELRNTTNYLCNNLLHDNMTPSILESSSTISPTSPQNSTGYSSCTVNDKVGVSKNQVMYESSISLNQTLDTDKSFYFEPFVFPSSPLPPSISPLGEVIQSFCSSTRDDNDMFSSSSTVRNEVTGTMSWEGNMMDDGVTSPFVNNSLLPPLSPYTETFYPRAIYNCDDAVTMVSAGLSEASESFCMEDERLASSPEDFGFHYRLWE